jgi:hypothetical protein
VLCKTTLKQPLHNQLAATKTTVTLIQGSSITNFQRKMKKNVLPDNCIVLDLPSACGSYSTGKEISHVYGTQKIVA